MLAAGQYQPELRVLVKPAIRTSNDDSSAQKKLKKGQWLAGCERNWSSQFASSLAKEERLALEEEPNGRYYPIVTLSEALREVSRRWPANCRPVRIEP